MKKSYRKNKFEISATTSNEEFELPDGSFSIPDIQEYFEYILSKYGENTVDPSLRIYISKTENRIIFRIIRIQDGEGAPKSFPLPVLPL